MSSLTKDQLELCEICDNQKYTVKHGLICNLSEKPAEFEKDCEKFVLNPELKAFRDNFRHQVYINGKIASIEVRFANYLLDFVFILVLSVVITILFSYIQNTGTPETQNHKAFSTLFSFVLYILYYFIFESLTSRTPAKYITRTVVITTECKKPTMYNILIRTLCRFIPLEPLSFLGDEQTGWHDEFSKTVVVFK